MLKYNFHCTRTYNISKITSFFFITLFFNFIIQYFQTPFLTSEYNTCVYSCIDFCPALPLQFRVFFSRSVSQRRLAMYGKRSISTRSALWWLPKHERWCNELRICYAATSMACSSSLICKPAMELRVESFFILLWYFLGTSLVFTIRWASTKVTLAYKKKFMFYNALLSMSTCFQCSIYVNWTCCTFVVLSNV